MKQLLALVIVVSLIVPTSALVLQSSDRGLPFPDLDVGAFLRNVASAVLSFFVQDARAACGAGSGTCYWHSLASANWNTGADWCSATNGGGTCGTVPATTDAVVFDANSGAFTITLVAPTTVASLSMSGAATTLDTSTSNFAFTVNGPFTVGSLETFNGRGSTITISGNFDTSAAACASWAPGHSTVVFAGTATIRQTGNYDLNCQNFWIVTINAGVVVTVVTTGGAKQITNNGPSPSLIVNGILDLNGDFWAGYDYQMTPLVTGPGGTGIIRNGVLAPRWGQANMTWSPGSVTMQNDSWFPPLINCPDTGNNNRLTVMHLGGNLNVTSFTIAGQNPGGPFASCGPNLFYTDGYTLTATSLVIGTTGEDPQRYVALIAGTSVIRISGSVSISATGFPADNLQLGRSVWYVTGSWTSSSKTANWSAGTSTVYLNGASAQTVTDNGISPFYTLMLQGGPKTFATNVRILGDLVNLQTDRTLTITAAKYLNVSGRITGSPGAFLALQSSVVGSTWYIVAMAAYYVRVSDSSALFGPTVQAYYSVNLGGNPNWNFNHFGGDGPTFAVACRFNPLTVTFTCSDQTDYSGWSVVQITWSYAGDWPAQVVGTSGANGLVSFRAPGQSWFSGDVNGTVFMDVTTTAGTYSYQLPVHSSEVLLWLGLAVLGIVLLFGAVRAVDRARDRSVYFMPVDNPSYRQTAISVDEYPKGWRSYRQHEPDKYVRLRSRRRGRLWVVYGIRPATRAEQERTGRKYVAEVQTVREKL